jgi:molybdopterin-guanine dinucleotide biosynthesis protein A
VAGRRIIDRVADALREATDDLLLVANEADAAQWLPGVRVVRDARTERGSLVGIHTSLVAAAGPVLIVAWDMPFLTGTLLRELVRMGEGAAFAAAACGVDGPQPFCAVYTPASLPFVEAALNEGDLRVGRLLTRLPVLELLEAGVVGRHGDPKRLFFNVNSAAQLAEAEQMAARG